MKNVFKFSENATGIENIENTNIALIMERSELGDYKLLKELFKSDSFQKDNLIKGHYKLLGWYFNLKPYCKRYLVNVKYFGWNEYYAPNKGCLYSIIGRHNVLEIEQLETKEEK